MLTSGDPLCFDAAHGPTLSPFLAVCVCCRACISAFSPLRPSPPSTSISPSCTHLSALVLAVCLACCCHSLYSPRPDTTATARLPFAGRSCRESTAAPSQTAPHHSPNIHHHPSLLPHAARPAPAPVDNSIRIILARQLLLALLPLMSL